MTDAQQALTASVELANQGNADAIGAGLLTVGVPR